MRDFRAEKILRPRGMTARPCLPNDGPLDLEIGCGVGWHPIQYAQNHPKRYLIAIEHTRAKFAAFSSRLRAHSAISNLLPVHADAIAWTTHFLDPNSLDRIILMYPNPFPKKKDLNKRWYAMPFMSHLLKCLKTNGELLLVTNEKFYMDEASLYFSKVWGLAQVEFTQFSAVTVPGGRPRTHFEKKYLNRGETCFQLKVQKQG